MGTDTTLELTCRDRAILRAVAGGGAELMGDAEPDLFLDGRCCADQLAVHRLARAGLIAAAVSGAPGSRVAARLTAVGRDTISLCAETTAGAVVSAHDRYSRTG